jgi:hypothetical protein
MDSGGSVTNGVSGSITAGAAGVVIGGAAGTVINDGHIAATSTLGGKVAGCVLSAGGSVTNAASASISASSATGVYITGGAGTVVNDGSIADTGTTGTTGSGVLLNSGGSVTNASSASIKGLANGVRIQGGAGTVVNDGSIAGTLGHGVYLRSGGSVTNATFALITGGSYGVDLSAGGTLTNAGTVVGTSGPAVGFGGTGSNRLVLDPGYRFSGLVTGSASASNTLELASAASVGTVTGLGTEFTNFGPIAFDAGAKWSITGSTAGLAGTISGFAAGDTIVVTGVTETTSSFSGGILTLDETVGSATLDLPGTFTSASNFHVAPVGGGTEVTVVPCFCAGTRILTVSGEAAVEELRIGDQVVTVSGCRLAPIVWLGHRHVNCLGHPRPHDVWPIRVKAGAIADGVPHRDLWLSPEHAVLLRTDAEPVLVPIRHLLNGTTIVQAPCEAVTYWHVELAAHDAIVAEGLPAETYLDTGNRADFANGGPAVTVHPTFADGVWRAKACAPQLRHGEALVALQRRLADRALAHADTRRDPGNVSRSISGSD